MTAGFPQRGERRMAVCGKSSVLLVGVIAASLLSAPLAGARQTCQDAGSHIRCETNGSVSIKAVPTTRAPNVGEILPPRRSGVIWSW
jgi:hypothetical protein